MFDSVELLLEVNGGNPNGYVLFPALLKNHRHAENVIIVRIAGPEVGLVHGLDADEMRKNQCICDGSAMN